MNEDEENTIDDTINNDAKEKSNSPVKSKIKNDAKNKAKNAGKKTIKKIGSVMLKPVGATAFSTFSAVIIVIFMLVGIISFITTMPGIVQEKITSFVSEVGKKVEHWWSGDNPFLNDTDSEEMKKAKIDLLNYLADMNLDPVGLGFVTNVTTTSTSTNDSENTEENTEENSDENNDYKIADTSNGYKITDYYDPPIPAELVELDGDSGDLLYKYIVTNERIYLPDNDGIKGILGFADSKFSGMLSFDKKDITSWTKVDVNREEKTMEIVAKNLVGFSNQEQTFKYNLESWVGRYGMPIEFLLALHIGTMSADIADELISNENLQTKVRIAFDGAEYEANYKIKLADDDGNEVPIELKSDKDDEIADRLKEAFYIEMTNENEYEIKYNGDLTKDEITINALRKFITEYKLEDHLTVVFVNNIYPALKNIGENQFVKITKKKIEELFPNASAEVKQDMEAVEGVFDRLINTRNDVLNKIMKELSNNIYGENFELTVDEINEIYDLLLDSTPESVKYNNPRIKYVIHHWFKDLDFSSSYVNSTDTKTFEQETSSGNFKMDVTLTNGEYKTQREQPYVIKGDKVTLDGEEIIDADYSGTEFGKGYEASKKIFTQGYYYVYDGTAETTLGIYCNKILEKVPPTGNGFLEVRVVNGRIKFMKYIDSLEPGAQKIDSGTSACEIYSLADTHLGSDENVVVKNYALKINEKMSYKSVAEYSYEETTKSVEQINGVLDAMGIVNLRQPISFDNVIKKTINKDGEEETTTKSGDAAALTAFTILEGMHTESAEAIYRDLKEFLIELGYYTKAEFDYLDTNVLTWFIPDYIPSDPEHWQHTKEEDVLYYGAMLYPQEKKSDEETNGETNEETNSETDEETDGETDAETTDNTTEGFTEGLDVVAPGNCKILDYTENSITLEFDGTTQPEIGILDGYVMIINGISLAENVTVLDENGLDEIEMSLEDAKYVKDGTEYIVTNNSIIGTTKDTKIQIILKDGNGAYLSNVEDYMAPKSKPGPDLGEIGYFFFVPYEGGSLSNPGIVAGDIRSKGPEVAVGIYQWTTVQNMNNISPLCEWLYNQNPTLCAELRTFINWSAQDIYNDFFYSGDSQLKKAFATVQERDCDALLQLEMQYGMEEKVNITNEKGLGWIMDRNSVTAGTLFSLINWAPNAGWEDIINENMTDEEIIIALMKHACTRNSTAGSLNARWNSQAKLAIDIINGEFTDIEDFARNPGNYPQYANHANDGYLDSK